MYLPQTGSCHRFRGDDGHDGACRLAQVLLYELQGDLCGEGRQPVLQLRERLQR